MLDTLRTVETPEGVRLELRAAGPVPRALAYAVDASVRWGAYFVLLVVLVAVAFLQLFGTYFDHQDAAPDETPSRQAPGEP